MKWLSYSVVVLLAISFLSACGKDKTETEGSIPQPGGTAPTPPPTNLPATDATPTNSGLPDLSRAVSINLKDKVNLTGLQDLAKSVFPPLVGDPLVSMDLKTSTTEKLSGKILIAFEDRLEFWGAILPSFPGTAIVNTQTIDLIFADDEFVIRSVSTNTSDNITGTLYYRLRQSGETACKQVTTTCEVIYDSPGYYTGGNSSYPDWCSNLPQVDTATPCRAYMNLSNSAVKELGTFSAQFSKWIVK